MKILHIAGWAPRGTNYRHVYYINEFNDKNNVLFLCADSEYKKGIYYSDNDLGVEKNIIRQKPFFKMGTMVIYPFRKILNNFNPDVVHIYEVLHLVSFFAIIYCYIKRIPILYEHEQRDHGLTVRGKIRSFIFSNILIRIINPLIAEIRVATPGASNFLQNYGINKNKIYISSLAYNSNINKFNNEERVRFREFYSIPFDKKIICTTGSFSSEKKIGIIINAFKNSLSIRNDIYLLIIGKIECKIVEESLKELPIDSYLYIQNFLSTIDLNKAYCASDLGIWVNPTISYFEALGTGLKILIPFGEVTNHLTSPLINFYGKNGSVDLRSNFAKYNDSNVDEIKKIITSICFDENRNAEKKYSSTEIAKYLSFQYQNILLNKCKI